MPPNPPPHDQVTDTPQANTPEPPTRESLLRFLDSELNLLSQQQKNSGWTSWACAGAMGALAWMLMGQWEAGWPAGNNWGLAYTTLALGITYTLLIIEILQTKTPTPLSNKARFHLGTNTPEKSKAWTAFNILQNSTFLLIIFHSPTSDSTRIWTGAWLGLALFFGLLFLILSYTQFPFEVNTRTSGSNFGWLYPLIHLLAITLLLLPIILLSKDLLASSPTALDIKIGGLLAAIHFLAKHSVDESGRRPLIDTLLKTRRELALGGMSTQAAARHIEIEFLGMRVSDVFHESAQKFIARSDALTSQCKSCLSSLDATLTSLSEGSKLSTQQQSGLISSVLETCHRQANEIYSELTKQTTDYNKIESKSRRLSSSSDARNAMNEILTMLHSRHAETTASYADVTNKIKQLKQMLERLKSSQAA